MATETTGKRKHEEEETPHEEVKCQKVGHTSSSQQASLTKEEMEEMEEVVDEKIDKLIKVRGPLYSSDDHFFGVADKILTILYGPIVRAHPTATVDELVKLVATKEWLNYAVKLICSKKIGRLIANALVDNWVVHNISYEKEEILQPFKDAVSLLITHFNVKSDCANGRVSDAFLKYGKFEIFVERDPLMLREILKWLMRDAGIDNITDYVTSLPFKGFGERTIYDAIHASKKAKLKAINRYFFGKSGGFDVRVSDAESECDF